MIFILAVLITIAVFFMWRSATGKEGMKPKNSQYKNPEREITPRKLNSEFHLIAENRWQDDGGNNGEQLLQR